MFFFFFVFVFLILDIFFFCLLVFGGDLELVVVCMVGLWDMYVLMSWVFVGFDGEVEGVLLDLLWNMFFNIVWLEDVIGYCVVCCKYFVYIKSFFDGEDVCWYFCKFFFVDKGVLFIVCVFGLFVIVLCCVLVLVFCCSWLVVLSI